LSESLPRIPGAPCDAAWSAPHLDHSTPQRREDNAGNETEEERSQEGEDIR